MRKTLTALRSCIKLTSADGNTHMYTMLHAYFLLFTRCLQIINHQPKVPLPTSFLSNNPAMDPLVLVIPPFTGRETETGTWQSWGQQMLWTWMFQGQVKLRALRTGSGTLDLALGRGKDEVTSSCPSQSCSQWFEDPPSYFGNEALPSVTHKFLLIFLFMPYQCSCSHSVYSAWGSGAVSR